MPSQIEPACQTPAEFEADLVDYFVEHRNQEVKALLLQKEFDKRYSLRLNLIDLFSIRQSLLAILLTSPARALQSVQDAIIQAQQRICEQSQERGLVVQELVQARLEGLSLLQFKGSLPASPTLGALRCKHLGALLSVHGTVGRTGLVQAAEDQRTYECLTCQHRFLVTASLELGGCLRPPAVCPAEDDGCKGTTFRHCHEACFHTDYREIRLQEKVESLSWGLLPRSFPVILQDELADKCKPGDDVEVTGWLIRRIHSISAGARPSLELVIVANNLTVVNERRDNIEVGASEDALFRAYWEAHEECPLIGRNKILASIAPQLFGMFGVKLAAALMLVGGVERLDGSGTHVRGQVHMLLLGDPGTGKSEFMRHIAMLSPRAAQTSGKGLPGPGLTVTASREEGNWVLEAGALVLADGGLCCIDDLDGIKEQERNALHEAMEQQMLSIAKPGLVTTLQTRTSVFGAMSPRRAFSPHDSLTVAMGLPDSLLSRFDVILLLLDEKNADWDATVADQILDNHQTHFKQPAQQGWPLEVLRQYLEWTRRTFSPTLTPEAEDALTAYFQLQRGSLRRDACRTTVRMLESLIRLSQAHARLMARNTVTLQDAVTAILVVEGSMQDAALLGNQNVLLSEFEQDPDGEYQTLEQRVMDGLSAVETDLY